MQQPIDEAQPATLPPDLAALFHDLNQPLGAINNYAQAGMQLIDNGYVDGAKLRELFGKIVAQSARATSLGRQVRAAAARHTGTQA